MYRYYTYNYIVAEINLTSGIVTLEACYNGEWFPKKWYIGIRRMHVESGLKRFISEYRKEFSLEKKKFAVEKYIYDWDENGGISCRTK